MEQRPEVLPTQNTLRWLSNEMSYHKKIDFLFVIDNVSSFLESNLSFGFFLIWALFHKQCS